MTELLPLLLALVVGVALGAAVTLAVARTQREHGTSASLAAERAAVDALVTPIAETLRDVRIDLARSERERAAAHADLRRQVEATALGAAAVGEQTGRLAAALRRSDVRGQWGEMQLRRIVESSGLMPHVHFEEQASTRDDAGALLRADLVVHLADGRDVVVDSKVPLAAYLEAVECDDDARRTALLAQHAADLAKHVDTLGSKEYWRRYDSPAFVVLFLPSEPLLSAALEQRPELLQRAFDKDVVLATPTTLLALLRTVAHTWRQESAARNARDVHALAVELHARIATVGKHMAKLGRQLDSAVGAYNDTVGSLEGRVLVTARRLASLGVVADSDDAGLPSPAPVTTAARPLTAAELVASADGRLAVLPDLDDDPEGLAPELLAGPRQMPGVQALVDADRDALDATRPAEAGAGGDVPYGWTS
ncbi:MAG: DNA recombination protein RmuC [Candidatus Nanopelagicales bacterium]